MLNAALLSCGAELLPKLKSRLWSKAVVAAEAVAEPLLLLLLLPEDSNQPKFNTI